MGITVCSKSGELLLFEARKYAERESELFTRYIFQPFHDVKMSIHDSLGISCETLM